MASSCSYSPTCMAKKTLSYSVPLRRKSMVFICSHPCCESSHGRGSIGTRVRIPWNTSSSHKRKFISRHGQCLSGKALISDTLYFWGEYEPTSEAVVINKTPPKAVFDKLIPVRGIGAIPPNALNSDPYVFGEHFKYICCNMGNRKHIPGDMILFGHFVAQSETGQLTFELDTVIVIKEVVKIDHTRCTTQYYKASIEPMGREKEFFYKGYNKGENKYFSFVPCLIQPVLKAIPSKPRLDLASYGFLVKKGWYSHVAASIPFSPAIWKRLIQDVTKAGWLLGTHIDKV